MTGATFGVLAVNTSLYVGPLSDIAGGVDLSTIGSGVAAAVVYVAAGAIASARLTSRPVAAIGFRDTFV